MFLALSMRCRRQGCHLQSLLTVLYVARALTLGPLVSELFCCLRKEREREEMEQGKAGSNTFQKCLVSYLRHGWQELAENCLPQPFILYVLPRWSMSAHQVPLFQMLRQREVIASSFVTWPVLVSKTDRIETDSGRQHNRLCQEDSVPFCSYSLHHPSTFLVEVVVQIRRCESLIT